MINDILEQLADTSSRLEKEAILKGNLDNAGLVQVITLALDPFTQFYIRKIPTYAVSRPKKLAATLTLEYVLGEELPKLSNRTFTGRAAIEHLQNCLESLCESDAKVLEKVIKKDLRCGVSTSTVNKIWPKLISEYPCMLASGYDDKLVANMTYPASAQLKMDGMRFNAIVRDGNVEFRSRNGRELHLLGNLVNEFLTLAERASFLITPDRSGAAWSLANKGFVFDGELMVQSGDEHMTRQQGNGILNKANKGTISADEAKLVCATIWDIIPYEYFIRGRWDCPYKRRLEALMGMKTPKKIAIVEHTEVNSLDEARVAFEGYLAEGLEGIILKNMNSPWEDTRAKHQIKFKGELECELEVVGWQAGTGKHAGRLGAVIAESSDGVIKVNVGSGFSDDQRNIYTREAVVGKIVSVKYNSRIVDANGSQSLFLPVFLCIRSDKDEADSSGVIK